MNEKFKYDSYYKKLQNICDENDLVCRIHQKGYPISMTVRPMTGPGQQLTMLEMAEDKGYISPDASLVFFYKDGDLGWKTSETFTIGDALFAKLKNLFKNLYFCWLQFFFRNCMELQLLSGDQMPNIEEEVVSGDEDEEECGDGPEDEGVILEGTNEKSLGYLLEDVHTVCNEEDFAPPKHPIDPVLKRAAEEVIEEGAASVSILVRRMGITFSEATKVLDQLEAEGIIGPQIGAEPREVLVDGWIDHTFAGDTPEESDFAEENEDE